MKERPIIFSGPMVTAILEGFKSQTRRVMKPQPAWPEEANRTDAGPGPFIWPIGSLGQQCGAPLVRFPFGQPGDRLWVRETWRIASWWQYDNELKVRYEADGGTRFAKLSEARDPFGDEFNRYWMESTDDMLKAGYRWEAPDDPDAPAVWRGEGPEPTITPTRVHSPIHMPRWASRLTLEVVSVRVERLQDITEAGIRAEGFGEPYDDWREEVSIIAVPPGTTYTTLTQFFATRWDELNAKRGHPWESNPWVWVVEFKKVDEGAAA